MSDSQQTGPSHRILGGLAILLCLSSVAGCRPEKEIRTYRIAKPEATQEAAPAESLPTNPKPRSGEPTDRMLGAIVPGPDQAWFFKAVGPKTQIDPIASEVQAFLNSIRFDAKTPTWDLPEGWSEKAGGGMRLATLVIPAGEGEIEMSVIGLGLQEDWEAQVLDNVNRWRGQLSQPPLAAANLADATMTLPEAGEGAVAIDETGWFESGGMTPPFAGRDPLANLPSTPPRPQPRPTPPAGDELKYEKPVNWTAGETSAMRKASFVTPGDAKVTAFSFPAAGQMGDRLGNANRWRSEVGLGPLTEEELVEQVESIELLGESGSYFEFVGEQETTYVAMVTRGPLVWFFKLRGPGEAVAEQRETFRGWLESLSL